MLSSQPVLSPALIVVCVVMVIAAALIYRLTALGSPWTVPRAGIRAAVQLAAVAGVLAAALTRLWSSMLVLAVMFVVASVTAARRSQASRGSALLTVSLAFGLVAVLPLLLLSGVVPLKGVAVVPIVAIVLGNTMTAVAVAARLALDTLKLRAGEIEAALSLGDQCTTAQPRFHEDRRPRHAAGSLRRRAAQHRIRHPGRCRTDPRPDSAAALSDLRCRRNHRAGRARHDHA
jgi:putative ABC transport system permease protein